MPGWFAGIRHQRFPVWWHQVFMPNFTRTGPVTKRLVAVMISQYQSLASLMLFHQRTCFVGDQWHDVLPHVFVVQFIQLGIV